MNTLLRDMLAHREWADATHIAALAAHEGACRDAAVIHRLHRMLLVQRHFLELSGGLDEPQQPSEVGFGTVTELAAHARARHDVERAYVASLSDAALDELIEIPFPQSPLRIPRWQAPAQSAMHSQHHRAQNATRLRELGGEPPTTDLILWYWLQRPIVSWACPRDSMKSSRAFGAGTSYRRARGRPEIRALVSRARATLGSRRLWSILTPHRRQAARGDLGRTAFV